ncbi:MAG: glucose-6-phosphate isomerase, partial [Oscillospiraceae bacterium]|nr:glucose-6-phosphate isomerase [Oscillospiraceae bacterium]
YAAVRQALYRSGRKVEILAAFEPPLHGVARWWRQLFGESEGKNGRGIFPSVCGFTSDLHSMGQYIQDGERTVFETFLSLDAMRSRAMIPPVEGLSGPASKLAGRGFAALNSLTLEAIRAAHVSGGVPVIGISSPDPLPEAFGALVVFFETACAASALLSGVDPFDQPGVEAYKRELYAALGLG